MKILSVHNQYQIRGGEDESRESEERLLREHGHCVNTYEDTNDRIPSLSSVALASKTIWSTETYKAVSHRLKQEQPDIVHVQNFFPLISPSVHYAALHQHVPVIQTLRNYRLLCPNALFFRNGQVCEDCMGQWIPYPGIVHRCYKENTAASAMTTLMISVHRFLKTWEKTVSCYIALTEFARNKFIQGGLPADKIFVKPNFVHPDPGPGSGSGDYALYVGRLSVEKGLDTLLEAWRLLKHPIELKIVGDGPLADQVKQATMTTDNITWLGKRSIHEVHDLMGEAKFLVFPSKWYETFGRVAVEAFAKGTPVIAANIGAIAELVTDYHTGRLFNPGDANDLADKVDWLIRNHKTSQIMGLTARQEFEAKFTASANYKRMLQIYNVALGVQ